MVITSPISFHKFKTQASFYLKEKIKTARLVLTDVTPVELLTEEVTNGNPRPPDTQTMGVISRAAFEVDDYWRIVEILHQSDQAILNEERSRARELTQKIKGFGSFGQRCSTTNNGSCLGDYSSSTTYGRCNSDQLEYKSCLEEKKVNKKYKYQ
ncbi:hypothetical protein QYF36_011674 [Acer negundo]|nr:hypothetical protein QYF36_011674 [Acer negundo]